MPAFGIRLRVGKCRLNDLCVLLSQRHFEGCFFDSRMQGFELSLRDTREIETELDTLDVGQMTFLQLLH